MKKKSKIIEKIIINNKKTTLTYFYEPTLYNEKLYLQIKNKNSSKIYKLEITNERFLEFLNELKLTYYYKYIHKDILNILSFINSSKNDVVQYIKKVSKQYGDSEYKVLKWFIGYYFLIIKDLLKNSEYIVDIYKLQLNLLFKENMSIPNIMKETSIILNNKLDLFLKEKKFFKYEDYILNETFKKEVTYDNNMVIKLGKTYIINAIAGSGKTTFLKNKVEEFIRKGISPYAILILSFNKSIVEDDLMNLKLKTGYSIKTLTIHSFCYQLLKNFGNEAFSLIEENEQKQLITNILLDLNLILDETDILIDKILLALSHYNNLLDKNNYDENYLEILKKDIIIINNLYKSKKEQLNKIDFDDLLWKTKELLDLNPFIMNELISEYCIIGCDEFQDVNELQWDILKRFRSSETTMLIVGDDDQSIYGFRGAQSQILVELSKQQDVIIKKLDSSYRCPKQVCMFADSIIKNNKNRITKNITSATIYNESQNVELKEFDDKNFIGNIVQYIINNKELFIKKDKTIAILCRTNNEINFIIEEITKLDSSLLNMIKITTIHKAKGLEYDIVILLDWFFISKNNLIQKNLINTPLNIVEEERRLFYVACTRTKENLYIFYRKKNKSIFISEGETTLNLTQFQLDLIKVFKNEYCKNIFTMTDNLKKKGYNVSVQIVEDSLFDLYSLNINLDFSKLIKEEFRFFVFDYLKKKPYADNREIWNYINNLDCIKNSSIRNISYFEIRCFKKEFQQSL